MAESNPSPKKNKLIARLSTLPNPSLLLRRQLLSLPAWLPHLFQRMTGINKLFYAVWTLAAGYAACVIVDAKVVPKIGLPKTIGVAGIFTGLAAAGLLTWQLNAGDAEKPPVAQPTKPPASMTLPQPAK